MAIILSPEPLMDDDPEISPSADGGDHLTGENAAANMAHEAFGHAYMYELTGGDTNNASHHYEVNVDNSYVGAMGVAEKYTTFSKNQQYKILNFWGK